MNDYKSDPVTDPYAEPAAKQPDDLQHIASFYESPPPIATPEVSATPIMPVSVLTQTPAQATTLVPVQSPVVDPGNNEPNYSAQKKNSSGKGLCVLIFVFLFLIIAGLTGISIFVAMTLKSRYVPVLSPMFEDLVNSPAEQLAQRADIYVDKVNQSMNSGVISNAPSQQNQLPEEINGLQNLAILSQLNVKFTMPTPAVKPSVTLPVLGITTGGTIDQNTIAQMLKDKEINIDITSEQKYDKLNLAHPASSITETLSVSSASNQFATSFNVTSVKGSSDNVNDLYFHLDYFPTNDYLNTKSIENKWVQIPGNYLTSLVIPANLLPSTTVTITPTPAVNTLQIQTALDNVKLFLRSDSMKKAITAAPAQTVNGTATKCYAIKIASADWANVMTDFETIFKTDTATNKSIQDNFLTNLAKSGNSLDITNTICFGSDLIIRKVDFSGSEANSSAGLNLSYSGSVQINSINKDNNITAPTDNIINIKDINVNTLIPTLSTYLKSSTVPTSGTTGLSGNTKRSSEIQSLGTMLSAYLFDNASASDPAAAITGVPECPATARIGTAFGNIDLVSIIAPGINSTLLSTYADPVNGNPANTGYTICKTGNTSFTIAAPLADNGLNISTSIIIP